MNCQHFPLPEIVYSFAVQKILLWCNPICWFLILSLVPLRLYSESLGCACVFRFYLSCLPAHSVFEVLLSPWYGNQNWWFPHEKRDENRLSCEVTATLHLQGPSPATVIHAGPPILRRQQNTHRLCALHSRLQSHMCYWVVLETVSFWKEHGPS